MAKIQVKRGTSAQLTTAAAGSQLAAGEVYLVTDESRLAVGLSVNTFEKMAKQSEAGAGSGVSEALAIALAIAL